MLPQCYPDYRTVHRRFQCWCRQEVLRGVLTDLANALRDEGALNESECFIDATFASDLPADQCVDQILLQVPLPVAAVVEVEFMMGAQRTLASWPGQAWL